MALVSITRLHLRSLLFLPMFVWRVSAINRQLRASAGFVQGRLGNELPYGFWTMTMWQDESAMNSYRITPPHLHAMPKLLEWCDEAAVVRWNQESSELPDWEAAEKKMAESGRLSKVNHPSAGQQAGRLDFIRNKAELCAAADAQMHSGRAAGASA